MFRIRFLHILDSSHVVTFFSPAQCVCGIVMALTLWGCIVLCLRIQSDHEKQGRWKKAMARMDALLEKDQQNAVAYWLKGELFELHARYPEALRCYRLAHQLCPHAYGYGAWRDASRRVQTYIEGRATPPINNWLAYSHSI